MLRGSGGLSALTNRSIGADTLASIQVPSSYGLTALHSVTLMRLSR